MTGMRTLVQCNPCDMSVVVVVTVLDVAVLVFVAAADIASHQYSSKSSCILMLIVPAR